MNFTQTNLKTQPLTNSITTTQSTPQSKHVQLAELPIKDISIEDHLHSISRYNYKQSLDVWLKDETEGTPYRQKETIKSILLYHLDNPAITTLKLSNMNLHSIPPLYGLTHIKKINLSNNRIHHIPPDTFIHLENVEGLNLSKNEIISIQDLELSFNKMLKHLNLNENLISEINGINATRCRNLKRIALENNPLTCIRNLNFSYCPSLEYFMIMHNLSSENTIIENICFTGCENLATLELSGFKSLTLGNFNFSECTNLGTIALTNNQIKELPEWDLSDCKELCDIYLNNNHLRQLSKAFLSKIKSSRIFILNLSNNHFETLDEAFLSWKPGFTQIELTNNFFSPDYVEKIKSKFDTVSLRDMKHYDAKIGGLKDLSNIFEKWNYQSKSPLYQKIIKTPLNSKNGEKYINLLIFLKRLYMETPRNEDKKTIPLTLLTNVHTLLDIIANSYPSETLIDNCCNIASQYINSCTDSLAIGLTHLFSHAQETFGFNHENPIYASTYTRNLYWLKKTDQFIKDLNSFKIVFNQETEEFINLDDIHDAHDEKIKPELTQQSQRSSRFIQLKNRGYNLKIVRIKDKTKEKLQLLNRLKSAGICEIDSIKINFETEIVLKTETEQSAAIKYLKTNYSV